MDTDWMTFFAVTVTLFVPRETAGFSIRNEQLGRCLQVQEVHGQARLGLGACRSGWRQQEWQWASENHFLRSVATGECLRAPKAQEHESVTLYTCGADGVEGQVWSCSKKGHLTLHGKGLHLSGHPDVDKVVLSKERGRISKWRTLANQTVCRETEYSLHDHRYENTGQSDSTAAPIRGEVHSHQTALTDDLVAATDKTALSPLLPSNVVPGDPAVTLFYLENGMGWKAAMLVLSSLALIIGLVILILSIYHNRKKRAVVMLKPYSPSGDISPPGSPAPNERAPLTKNPMKPPRSPSLLRGEILVEWKDGTVTPLFDNSCLTN